MIDITKSTKLFFSAVAVGCVMLYADDTLKVSYEGEVPIIYHELTTTLAQQSLMCDFAGTGRILEYDETHVALEVINLWCGNTNTPSLNIQFNDIGAIKASTNDVVIFMASTNLWWQSLSEHEPPLFENIYTFSLVTNPPALPERRDKKITAINDAFPFTTIQSEGTDIEHYASNLVYTAKLAQDAGAFNSIIQAAMSSPNRKIVDDALSFTFFRSDFLPTNLTVKANQIIQSRMGE